MGINLTKEELSSALRNVMDFETEDLFNKVLSCLISGDSALIDAISYIGNGRYVQRNLKKRYKYKLIVPIVDRNMNLYSTDLYEGSAERAIKGEYGIYRHTRQLCIDFISKIPTDYDKNRFDYGYRDEEYGISKINISSKYNEKVQEKSN